MSINLDDVIRKVPYQSKSNNVKPSSKSSFFAKTITTIALYLCTTSYVMVQHQNHTPIHQQQDQQEQVYNQIKNTIAEYIPQEPIKHIKPYEEQKIVWSKDYLMGEAFGMVDLNTKTIFLNEERITYKATDGEIVKMHEGRPGHLTYGGDEWLTRVNTYTTSTVEFEMHRKHGA